MGKWTSDYYDDVLASRMKTLVDGAVQRLKLEKVEPTISYQALVEGLDVGDSFTTSIIDILVKEMADRQTRHNSSDRRLIADRTAKSLRMLTTSLRIYRERSNSRSTLRRQSVNLTEYIPAPHEEMDEDDDEFDTMLETASSGIEGTRMNSELYDAYHAQSWTHPLGSSLPPPPRAFPPYSAVLAPSSIAEAHAAGHILSPIRSPPVPSARHRWTVGPLNAGPSNLHRVPTIRRPARSRTVDFNDFGDFTSRRRAAGRQNSSQEPGGSRYEGFEASDEDSAGPSQVRSRSRSPGVNEATASLYQDENVTTIPVHQAARRFFPFSRNRRQEATQSLHDNEAPAENVNDAGAQTPLAVQVVTTRSWLSMPSPLSPSPSNPSPPHAAESDINDDRPTPTRPISSAPSPLRRGGVPAPESVQRSRRTAPLSDSSHHDAATVLALPPPDFFDVDYITHLPTPSVSSQNDESDGPSPRGS